MTPTSLGLALTEWYAFHGRDLPWRHTRDPYAIWLSEVILQQTRIAQGEAYWHRFMALWPTVDALATASEDEVLKAWQGLGYYSRARNLHKAAQQVVARGAFPDSYEGLLALKGVGDYTAAAIASFAYGLPHAAVDGNFYRVLSRIFGIDTPIDTKEGKQIFEAMAAELGRDFRTINSAMMDFGALQCTPRHPHCTDCPLVEDCIAFRSGRVETLPVKQGRVVVRQRRMVYIYPRIKGFTAIHRRPAGDIWQGLWEPLLCEHPEDKSMAAPLPQWPGRFTLLAANIKHVLTHQRLLADLYLYEADQRPPLPKDYLWIRESDFSNYAIPRLVELLLEKLER